MAEHRFTLVLTGLSKVNEEVEDRLFEAGCDDALLSFRDGIPYLDFDRESESLKEAILSAIADVEGAGLGAIVVRVEPDELLTATEIAERTGRTRESIRLLAGGRRGIGGFPPPIRGMKRRSRFWRWVEVAAWFTQYEGNESSRLVEEANTIAAINGALALRHYAQEDALDLLGKLFCS